MDDAPGGGTTSRPSPYRGDPGAYWLPPAHACIALTEGLRYVDYVPGRPKDHRRFWLTSGRQLWRLNELGRLRLVDDAVPIGSNEAKVVIAAEFQRLVTAPGR